MKKQNQIFILTLAFTLLSSCGTVGDYKRDERGKKLKGACDSAYATTLIGKNFNALKQYEKPVNYRLILPDSFVTQDYNPSRINLYLDSSSEIQKISCG